MAAPGFFLGSSEVAKRRLRSMQDKPRRFSPPLDIEDNGARLIVRDHAGQALTYVYYENQAGAAHGCGVARAQ